MLILNKFLLPEAGLKHIIMNSFSNIYLQIWIRPVHENPINSESIASQKLWSIKWSMFIVEMVLNIENLVILIILLVGLQPLPIAQKAAR